MLNVINLFYILSTMQGITNRSNVKTKHVILNMASEWMATTAVLMGHIFFNVVYVESQCLCTIHVLLMVLSFRVMAVVLITPLNSRFDAMQKLKLNKQFKLIRNARRFGFNRFGDYGVVFECGGSVAHNLIGR